MKQEKQEFCSRFSLTSDESIDWGDMDAYQHVNNVRYFRYFENVRIAYFEKAGITQLMLDTQIGPILGSTDCKFLAPLTFPDNITVATRVSQLKEKRFTMVYEVFSEKLARVVAQGHGEIVYVDYNSGKTCAVPDTIVNSIKALEASFKWM